MASLSRSLYDKTGLAPRMDVLLWGRRNFQINFSIRNTSKNAWNRHSGSFMVDTWIKQYEVLLSRMFIAFCILTICNNNPLLIRLYTKPWPYHRSRTFTEFQSPRGFKFRILPPYPQRVVKWRLNGAVSRNNRIERMAPSRCSDGFFIEPYEKRVALGARPSVQLLLQSTCTSMCRHIYDWNIVDCYVKQPIHLTEFR